MAWPATRRLLLLGAVFVALRLALAWAWPLLLAVALAALLEPPVAWLSRTLGLPRAVVAAAVLAAGLLAGIGIGVWVVGHGVAEAVALRSLAPLVVSDLRRAATAVVRRLGPPGLWPEPVRLALLGETADAGRALSALALTALRTLAALPAFGLGLGLALVAAYLILVDGPLAARLQAAFVDVPPVLDLLETVRLAATAAWRLVSTELVLAALSAVLSAIAFRLLGASVPVLLGILAGLLDLVPYAGPAVLLLPWAGYLALVGDGGHCLAVLAAWLFLALLRAILELRWVGRGIGLSTLTLLVSFYVGARTMGVAGVLVGPVVAAAFWAVWREGRAAAAARARPGPRRRLRWRPAVWRLGRGRWRAG